MAMNDDNTIRPFDALAELAAAYEALQLLAMSEDGHGSPVATILFSLNRQLQAVVNDVDARGLLS